MGKDSNSTRITKQQLHILELIYRFRFVSTKHIKFWLDKQYLREAQQLLQTLLSKDYIGRNYTTKAKLHGEYASYYLLPKGLKVLKNYQDSFPEASSAKLNIPAQANQRVYRDKTASAMFIRHNLSLADANIGFRRCYSQTGLSFYAKNELHGYSCFPKQLPDAYVSIRDNIAGTNCQDGSTGAKVNTSRSDSPTRRNHYFLELCEEAIPAFVYRRKIISYIHYAETGLWEKTAQTSLPALLLLCESQRQKHRLLKVAAYEADHSFIPLTIKTTTWQQLGEAKPDEPIWQVADIEKKTVEGLTVGSSK
jgi:hypothetical protein